MRLSPAGSEQSDFISQVDPGVSIKGVGGKLKVDADYALQQRFYMNNDQASGHNHALRSFATVELWDKRLFLDGTALVSQQNVSTLLPQTASNINLTGNRTNVRRFGLSPHWTSNFGPSARLQVRYAWDQVNASGTTSQLNSEGNKLDVTLSGDEAFHNLGWSLSYTNYKINYTAGSVPSSDNERVTANLRYALYPTFALLGSVGHESNTYTSSRSEISGPTWSAGAEWIPGPRTKLRGTIGERYFGRTVAMDFSHRTRATNWTLGYSEDVVLTPSRFGVPASANTALALDALFAPKIPDPIARQQAVIGFITQNGLPLTLDTPLDFATNQVFLSKRLHGSVGYLGTRATGILNVFRDRRIRESSSGVLAGGLDPFAVSNDVDQTGIALVWSYRLSSQTTATISSGITRVSYAQLDRADNSSYLHGSLQHKFHPRLTGSLDIRASERDSNAASAGYRERQVAGFLQVGF